MVDAKAMNWTMLNIPSEGITHTELLAKRDLHLEYMGHSLFEESVKQTIPLMVPGQMIDYKAKFTSKNAV